MADLFSPMKFDEAQCKVKAAGTGDAIDPKHIAVDPSADNIITNDPQTGLKVVAEDFISAEEGNIAKASQADGGVLVKATDMVSDAECNALSVTNDGKLALIPEDLISDVMGGNPLGINPDDCKLYINPCLLPGPQNIVSKDEDNLIVEDPEDCSALLKYGNVASSDAGNLIEPGTDGKLNVTMQSIVDKQYFGAGLVYVERQDGSHVLQVAACDGLTFHEGTKTDVRGNSYYAKWLTVNLDEGQNLLYFVSGDECTECFEGCGELSIEFSLNANGEKLRILDRSGNVYKQINLSNGLQGDGSGGLTINTLDSLGAGTSDLPVSAKAVKAAIDALQFAPIPHDDTTTQYGAGSGTKYGHVKLSASHTSDLGVGDGTAATPSAVKKAYDDGTRQGDADTFGQVKLTDSLTSTSCASAHVGLSACAGKQLKDLIDQIIGPDDPDDPGTSDARKAIYDLRVKEFEAHGSGASQYVSGKIYMPKVSGKRLNASVFAIMGIDYSTADGSSRDDVLFDVAYVTKLSGADTGWYVSVGTFGMSNSSRDAMVSALNTAAGTEGIPLSELAHYRVENAATPGGTAGPTNYFVVAISITVANAYWLGVGQEVTAGNIYYPLHRQSRLASTNVLPALHKNSWMLTTGEAVPYTKNFVSFDAEV